MAHCTKLFQVTVNSSHPPTHARLQLEPVCRPLGQTKLFFNNFSPYATSVHPSSFDSAHADIYAVLASAVSGTYLTDAKKGYSTFMLLQRIFATTPKDPYKTLAYKVCPVNSKSYHFRQISRAAILKLIYFLHCLTKYLEGIPHCTTFQGKNG